MAQRHNHYEAAFEDFVRSRGWPYVPVDEQRKAIFAGAKVKSFDYIVYPPGEKAWLVDVKGRKFPYEGKGGRRYWENWVTRDDLAGLRSWESVFGDRFDPVFVFAYWLLGNSSRDPTNDVHFFRGESYAFLVVTARDYETHSRQRSPKWDTVSVPTAAFRRLVSGVDERAIA